MSIYDQVWAVPGANFIIDRIHPETGLTLCFQRDEASVLAEYPTAVRMSADDWTTAQAERQHTPITWEPSTAEQYDEMLGCLPPAYWAGGAFLVGEPSDHDYNNGRPRFQAYWHRHGAYLSSSRPVTIAEMKAELNQKGIAR